MPVPPLFFGDDGASVGSLLYSPCFFDHGDFLVSQPVKLVDQSVDFRVGRANLALDDDLSRFRIRVGEL